MNEIIDMNEMDKPTEDKLEKILKDVLNIDNPGKNFVIYTGESGMDEFDISIVVNALPHEDLKDAYRGIRVQLRNLKYQNRKIKRNWIVKLLIKLKLIKL